MVLAFEFEYLSQNRVLENILKSLCDRFSIRYSLSRNDSIVTLLVDDTKERLGEFSDYLAENLPLSIFFKSSSVKVVENFSDGNVLVSRCDLALPFTKLAYTLAKDKESKYYLNPFTPNEIGLTCKELDKCSLELLIKGEVYKGESYEDIYKKVASLIKDDKVVKIKTPNGMFAFGKIDDSKVKLKGEFEVIPTDYSLIRKMVVLQENEMIALASLEKPIIEAKLNLVFEAKSVFDSNRVDIRLPNNLLLQFICEELYKAGVEFIFKASALDFGNEYLLNYNINTPEVNDIKIVVLENSEILIKKGDGYASKRLKEKLKKLNNPSFSQFASVLKERNLFDEKVSGFYFSKDSDDAIMFYSEKDWIVPLVKFPVYKSVQDIFKAIEESSPSGEKLIKNYKKTYPKLYENAFFAKIPENLPNNIYTVLGFVSLILGFSEKFEGAAERIIEFAEDFGGQKGPRIDSYLQDREKINSDFNTLKFIQSTISFKLAGVDELTLSFGMLESLSYFISDMADAHSENFGSKKVALCGMMFGSKRFAEIVCKNLLSNHKVYFNRELPIDNI